jgi:phosphatidylserine/phosphatidylglycerophosphate/cardiolipin synthase-like enzyme
VLERSDPRPARSGLFVTSANLTEAALDRNLELGILVRDRALALSVTSHFRELIDRRLLLQLPLG